MTASAPDRSANERSGRPGPTQRAERAISAFQPDGVFDAAAYGFSQGVLVDGVLYVSGQVSTADGLAAQVADSWASVVAVVEEAGGTAADIVKVNVFTLDPAAWTHLQPIITSAMDPPYPAATMVTVVGLANPDLLVEIEATAHPGAST